MDNLKLNPKVDLYLVQGCMRCPLGATPQCKVIKWRPVIEHLRQIVLEADLTEELKWGNPCYTHKGKNLLMIAAFKNFAFISFFKGALLEDKYLMLVKPGQNSQASGYIKFLDPTEVTKNKAKISWYIKQAKKLEDDGKKVDFKKELPKIPEELTEVFENDEKYKEAFFKLTPGRQRGYLLYFIDAKRSQTRIKRIIKCREKIISGIGFNEY